MSTDKAKNTEINLSPAGQSEVSMAVGSGKGCACYSRKHAPGAYPLVDDVCAAS